jgi:hypothetical protein
MKWIFLLVEWIACPRTQIEAVLNGVSAAALERFVQVNWQVLRLWWTEVASEKRLSPSWERREVEIDQGDKVEPREQILSVVGSSTALHEDTSIGIHRSRPSQLQDQRCHWRRTQINTEGCWRETFSGSMPWSRKRSVPVTEWSSSLQKGRIDRTMFSEHARRKRGCGHFELVPVIHEIAREGNSGWRSVGRAHFTSREAGGSASHRDGRSRTARTAHDKCARTDDERSTG